MVVDTARCVLLSTILFPFFSSTHSTPTWRTSCSPTPTTSIQWANSHPEPSTPSSLNRALASNHGWPGCCTFLSFTGQLLLLLLTPRSQAAPQHSLNIHNSYPQRTGLRSPIYSKSLGTLVPTLSQMSRRPPASDNEAHESGQPLSKSPALATQSAVPPHPLCPPHRLPPPHSVRFAL